MKLRDAMVCMDCEEVFDPQGLYRFNGGDMAACPACGSGSTALLSRWVRTMSDPSVGAGVRAGLKPAPTTIHAELQYLVEKYGAKDVLDAIEKALRREMLRDAAEKLFGKNIAYDSFVKNVLNEKEVIV